MDTTSGTTPSSSSAPTGSTAAGTPTASQAAEQLKATLSTADGNATQQIQTLGQVHQARLAQGNRAVAALTAQYGVNDPRVKVAQASVAATKNTVARVSLVHQQLAAPAVQVSSNGWALQGRVVDAQLQPAARFTVFLVDANKAFLQQYGFSYTDDTGYFLINYAGDNAVAGATKDGSAAPQLYVEVANTDANPVYLSSTPFQPAVGSVTFQTIVLPAGGEPIGDPPAAIRAVALPKKSAKGKTGTTTKSPKS